MILNIDFVEPKKDCKICDHINDYVCFDCESLQVKNKYPNAQWQLPDWVINETISYSNIDEANNDKI